MTVVPLYMKQICCDVLTNNIYGITCRFSFSFEALSWPCLSFVQDKDSKRQDLFPIISHSIGRYIFIVIYTNTTRKNL